MSEAQLKQREAITELKNAAFAATFNKLLKGKTSTGYTTKENVNAGRKKEEVAAKFINSLKKQPTVKKKTTTKSKISTEVSDDLTQTERLTKAVKDDSSILDNIKETGGGILGAIGSVLERPLDLVSRPAYATAGMLKETVKAINQGEPLSSVIDDAGYGAWRGLSGQDKPGFGQVIQEGVNGPRTKGELTFAQQLLNAIPNPIAPGNPALFPQIRNEQIAQPTVAAFHKNTLGGIGDVVTDPTTWAGAGVVSKYIKGGKEIVKGAEVIDSPVVTAAKAVVKDAIKDSPIEHLKVATKTPTGMTAKSIPIHEAISNSVGAHVEDLIISINAGAQKGKVIGTREALKNASLKIAEISTDTMLIKTNKKITIYLNQTRKWSSNRLAKEIESDPVFGDWYKEYKQLDPLDSLLKEKSDTILKDVIRPYVDEIYIKAEADLKNSILKVPTIRVLGKDVLELPKLGAAYSKIPFSKIPGQQTLVKMFLHSAQFPGTTSLVESRQRVSGITQFERDRNAIVSLSRGYNKSQLKGIQDNLNQGLAKGTDTLQDALSQGYRDIADAETAANVRKMGKGKPVENYVYIHIKKGDSIDITKFNEERALAAKQGVTMPSIIRAKELGLVPEEDAVRNYLYRLANSNSKVTRANFTNDIAAKFGIKGNYLASQVKNFKLQELSPTEFSFLSDPIIKGLKDGEKLYLDKDIYKVLKRATDISSGSSPIDEATDSFIKSIDFVTKKFKVWNTVYFPAYHVKNFLGDMFLGSLDGVTPKDYAVILGGIRNPEKMIRIGNTQVSFNRLNEDYLKNAKSGFASTEGAATFGKGKFTNYIHAKSESREDWGRLAHYYRAIKEEYPVELAKIKDRKLVDGVVLTAYEKATQNAILRVNKYKFDFQAITPFERNFVRRGIPFYTYLRKAIPTIVESMFLSPRNLSYVNKAQNALGEGNIGMLLPDWMRELGYSQLVGGDEPWGITNDLTPAATLQSLNPTDIPSKLNPMLQAVFELGTGKDTFTQQKYEGLNDPSRITNKIRAATTVQRVKDHKSSYAEQIYQFFGLPIRQVNASRQKSAVQSLNFKLKEQVSSASDKIEKLGLHAGISNRNGAISIRIWDEKGKVVGDFTSGKEFDAKIKELTKN